MPRTKKDRYKVTIAMGTDNDGTFVVQGAAKGGGGYYGTHTIAEEARKNMLRVAGGISRIATRKDAYYAMDRDKRWERTQKAVDPRPNGEDPKSKAIRTTYIPHKPESLTFEFGAFGDFHWTLEEGK